MCSAVYIYFNYCWFCLVSNQLVTITGLQADAKTFTRDLKKCVKLVAWGKLDLPQIKVLTCFVHFSCRFLHLPDSTVWSTILTQPEKLFR